MDKIGVIEIVKTIEIVSERIRKAA